MCQSVPSSGLSIREVMLRFLLIIVGLFYHNPFCRPCTKPILSTIIHIAAIGPATECSEWLTTWYFWRSWRVWGDDTWNTTGSGGAAPLVAAGRDLPGVCAQLP